MAYNYNLRLRLTVIDGLAKHGFPSNIYRLMSTLSMVMLFMDLVTTDNIKQPIQQIKSNVKNQICKSISHG